MNTLEWMMVINNVGFSNATKATFPAVFVSLSYLPGDGYREFRHFKFLKILAMFKCSVISCV